MTNLPRIRGMVAYGTPAETAQYFDLNFASVGVSTETGTAYTFRPTDSGGWVRFTNSSAVTATIAPFSLVEFGLGVVIWVEQAGSGSLTVAAGSGVTIYGLTSTTSQYSVLRLVNVAKNEWNVTEDGDGGGVVADQWTLIGDTNSTIPATAGRFVLNAALTAPRTWTLPAASGVSEGSEFVVLDKAGGVTNVNTLTIARAGSDTIAGQAAAVLSMPYDSIALVSDGVSAWSIESGWRNRASRTRFWSSIDNGAAITTPRVLSVRERIFAGAAVDYSALNRSSPTYGWLTASTGANWIPRDSSITAVAEDGNVAVSGASRSSDGPAATAAIGVAGFAVADAALVAWGGYFEAIRQHASGTGIGIEVDVRNSEAGATASNPYARGNGPHGLWVACGPGSGSGGYGPAPINNSDSAMFVLCNTAGSNVYRYQRGIVFEDTSLDGTDGEDSGSGSAVAVALARKHRINWYAEGGLRKVTIESALNSTDVNWNVYWANEAMVFARNNAAEPVLQLTGQASAVNYFVMANTATGVGPVLQATGSDTNIDAIVTPKGTGTLSTAGSVKLNTGTAIPAAGDNTKGLKFSSTANFGVFYGSGAPTLSAAKGSLYLRSDGSGTNDRMYVNTNGSTTWTAVVTVA